ncbi:MAG: DUF6805 domain-containing protein, partial [Verrucomicrobiota bacterium]
RRRMKNRSKSDVPARLLRSRERFDKFRKKHKGYHRLPDKPLCLAVEYWGSDKNRTFDILVDDTKITSQTLERNEPGELFTVEYPLPVSMTQGKQKITVTFRSVQGKVAGGVFGCATVRRE